MKLELGIHTDDIHWFRLEEGNGQLPLVASSFAGSEDTWGQPREAENGMPFLFRDLLTPSKPPQQNRAKKKHFTKANCTSSCQEVWLDLGQKHVVQQFQSFPPNGQTMRRIFQLTGGNCAAKTSARWQNMLPGISTTRLT